MSRAENYSKIFYPDKEGTNEICVTWLQRNAYVKGFKHCKEEILEQLEQKLEELWDKLPDTSKVLEEGINTTEANVTGKYNALNSFRKFIEEL